MCAAPKSQNGVMTPNSDANRHLKPKDAILADPNQNNGMYKNKDGYNIPAADKKNEIM